jgi:TolB-like protein
MKRHFVIAAFLAVMLLPSAAADKTYKLDTGIAAVAKNLTARLAPGTKIVIVDIRSKKQEASEYIIEELTSELVEIGTLVVVDRQSLDAIRSELTFQSSGDVSDESAQKLGAMLGAQTLISGSFELFKNRYRFAVKAVKVETSEIQYINSLSIFDNSETEALFGESEGVTNPNSPDKQEMSTNTSSTSASVGKAVRGVADFTGRFICSSVNPFFGIGSYMQGDGAGGGTVVFWEVVGLGGIGYGLYREANGESNAGLVTGLGGVCLGGGILYSIIRPWTYNRAPKLAETLDNMRVSVTSAETISFRYVVKY